MSDLVCRFNQLPVFDFKQSASVMWLRLKLRDPRLPKIRDSRIEIRDRDFRDLKVCEFCQNFYKNFENNVITGLKLKFFRILGIFLPVVVFLTCRPDTTEK